MAEIGQHQKELRDNKEAFEKQSPVVPHNLASYLGRQRSIATDHRLWAEPEVDLAAWAHARAHARNLDEVDIDPPGELQSANRLIMPLVPPPLEWGASSHFQDKVVAALDSPIIHAWLYHDESKAITEVVITGRGIPSVRAQVIAAILSCFLAVEPHINNFVLDGLIRVTPAKPPDEVGENAQATWFKRLLIPFHGSDRAEIVIPASASEAMLLLQGALKRLQDDTGFVQLHMIPSKRATAFQHVLAEHRRRAAASDDCYLWDGKAELGTPGVVISTPIQRLAGIGAALRLELSSDLLDTPPYRELSDTYHNALIQDVLEDVRRREHFYTEMLEQHKNAKDWYANLGVKEKKELPDVTTDYEIDWETGLLIRLASPGRVPASQYYSESMDYKIREDTKWLEMMRRLQTRINYVLNHETAPLKRIIAARLFDAALRHKTVNEAPSISPLMDKWKKLVQPVLWLEWRRLLEREGIEAGTVWNRHTAFNLSLDERAGKLFLFPQTFVDSLRSVVLFDRSRKTVIVFDGTDYAVQAKSGSEGADGKKLLEEARTLHDVGQVQAKLKEAIARDPRAVGQAIVNEWLEPGDGNPDGFEQIKASALFKEGSGRAALSALRWSNESCIQSAEEVLARRQDSTGQPTVVDAAAVLMRAYLKCFQAGHAPTKALTDIINNQPVPPDLIEAAQLAWQAHKLSPEMVSHFLRQGVLQPRAFLPSGTPSVLVEEEGALSYLAAIEAAKATGAMDLALKSLQATQETRRTAFYKIVPAIEESLAMEFASRPTSLDELLELLVGEKKGQKRS